MTVTGLSRIFVMLGVCVACGGKSRVIHSAQPDDGGVTDAAADADEDEEVPNDSGSCVTASIPIPGGPQQIVFGAPRSSIMGEPISTGSDVTRFEAMRDSLLELIDGLDPRTIVGLALSPAAGESCGAAAGVSSRPLGQELSEPFRAAFATATPVDGVSSLSSLLFIGMDHYDGVVAWRRRLVILLDGADAPSSACMRPPTELEDRIANLRIWNERNPPAAYFIAAPGSGAGEQARSLAAASGCNDCYEDFTDVPSFADILLARLVPPGSNDPTCEIPLLAVSDDTPLELDAISVTASYDNGATETLTRADDCSTGAGFTVSAESRTLSICPVKCGAFANGPSGSLEVVIGCGTDPAPEPVCVAATFQSGPPRTLGLELVLPISNAMNDPIPGDSRTRFEATHDAIVSLIKGLDPWHQVGLVLTPHDASCGTTASVPAAPLADGRARLLSRLESVADPKGNASLYFAYVNALQDLDLVGPEAEKVIVLFFDGAPAEDLACSNDEWAEDLDRNIEAAYEAGITTLLVATPGSESRDLVDDFANGYGCPGCALDFRMAPDFAPLLAEAVFPIRSVDVSCDFPLPTAPMGARFDLDSVQVTVEIGSQEPVTLPRVVDCEAGLDGQLGYQIVEGPRIILCPVTCAEITSATDVSMTIDACLKP